MKYDVFISHSSKDLELSEKICDYLQEQGIKCWIDSRNVTGLYARSIIEGIEQSELMVLVYSGKANSSAHVENEIDNAFCLGKMIIPFRIEGPPYSNVLRYYLNKSHYVDGMPDPLNALEQLRDQIKRNMSEQKQLEAIDEAFKTIAQWADINVDELRAYIKNIKEPEQNSEENEQGDRYDILQNEEGKIVIVINDHEGEPDNPRIVYDGTDKALLYRNKKTAVVLEHICAKAKEPLMKVDEILVVEVKDDDVVREYKVPMRKVKSLRTLY